MAFTAVCIALGHNECLEKEIEKISWKTTGYKTSADVDNKGKNRCVLLIRSGAEFRSLWTGYEPNFLNLFFASFASSLKGCSLTTLCKYSLAFALFLSFK